MTIKTSSTPKIKIDIPENESLRLQTLDELQLYPVTPEDNFDNITKLASFICKTPVSLITIIGQDKQWMKSATGTNVSEIDRDISHCTHAILEPGNLMEVRDTRKDMRFAENPFTTGQPPILFYAGMPLKAPNGAAMGTLCVLDTEPRTLDDGQKEALKALAKQVENLFELRRQNLHLQQVREQLNVRNTQLKDFAGTVAHDMKMPLANIIITSDLLRAKYGDQLDLQGKEYLHYLKQSSFKLSNYIQGILEHYESDTLTARNCEEFDIHDLLEGIIDLLNIDYDCVINLPEDNKIIHGNRTALEQIFLNLIGNSLKYTSTEKIVINIHFREDKDFYYFAVEDNGIGIPQDKQEEIFELFTVLAESDRSGNRGNGIGLSTVKKLILSLDGAINVKSKVKKGTTIEFSVKRVL
ncbi:GAF domain-containing sensor histidine kinase [Antarcticibacterium flavum]|uniref:histidine kinase n=1 Tax=Antarcticibacterium flavum TaxID=2058175 RepID=A0A5B7X736_9FLAO|nr:MULTISPECIES: GAF domain-containing sensor histidine kinase [Antarcticibacterium]MCM4160337.1 ATPase [Antarcticibacterium sp. W02-3]QCY71284.1 GAF domain-containing sensor histidine kinase [Antarcticibacterium flavum]